MWQVQAVTIDGGLFEPAKNFDQIGDLVSVIIQNGFVLAGIIAFALLVFAGFGMIMAAGAGDSKKMEQGKNAIVGAVVGLILVFASVWIIQLIEAMTGMKGKIVPFR